MEARIADALPCNGKAGVVLFQVLRDEAELGVDRAAGEVAIAHAAAPRLIVAEAAAGVAACHRQL